MLGTPVIAAAILAPMRCAAFPNSRAATWAYPNVMLGCLWPSRREITGYGLSLRFFRNGAITVKRPFINGKSRERICALRSENANGPDKGG